MPRERTEKELAEALAEGDEEAARLIYEKLSPSLFAFLVGRLGDRSAAEDVLQQVFLEIWSKADRFDSDRGSLMAWSLSMASSRAIDYQRKRVPDPRDPQTETSVFETGSGSDGEIDEFLSQWEFARLVDGLPEEQASLLRMRFASDLSQSEIAERTGVPLGTVKARMVAGMKKIRERIEAGA